MHYSCFFLFNQNPHCILYCTLPFQVAPYCASKWAIEGLTRSLAKELPPGLAAIALSPGVVNTDMLTSCFGSSAALYQTTETW
jgi:NAD(P)-dependent dehydrogenase (short-subunit alcohol dehydrogenase family)